MEISGSEQSKAPPVKLKVKAIEGTPENFKEYGQLIEPSPDGEEYGPQDAQLNLSQGIPRFYTMILEKRPLGFATITHHASVTQCLGSIGGQVWYLGVAKPSILDAKEIKEKQNEGMEIEQSRCGHYYVPPAVDEVKVFRISGPKFVKLDVGTWHAGPLFKGDSMNFFNLELTDTNVVDHTTHDFRRKNGVVFSIDD
ncbi:hypothetical protein JCGZ_06673 [Jatropha curcas]|uniref:Ureidoglycolate hydrolase n=1 Tax=Jatropha curcas TaxID=180498 RepID=A0A067LCN2_JATCU|nr:hypothetical protein JCGZ_06673 [Jatropha curcas]